MTPLLTISPLLTKETVLHRTMDFFSVALMVEQSRLMFTRADCFSDQNEGIDRLLGQLDASLPGGGCGGMGWSDAGSARREHDRVKRSHYVSCWSMEPESVAMWSLYSQDLCSVRVSTKLVNLIPAVEALVDKYSIMRISEADRGNSVIAATEARIEPVHYTSLSELSRRIGRRAGARFRLRDRYRRQGRSMPTLDEVDPRYWKREQQRRFSELRTTCRLKDSSFAHEQEVRLCVRLGEEICVDGVFDGQKLMDPSHEHHEIIKEHMKAWGWVRNKDITRREFVECPGLVESVALDPRCAPHKADFMTAWFQQHGVQVTKSTCFGYLPDSFSVFPDR